MSYKISEIGISDKSREYCDDSTSRFGFIVQQLLLIIFLVIMAVGQVFWKFRVACFRDEETDEESAYQAEHSV